MRDHQQQAAGMALANAVSNRCFRCGTSVEGDEVCPRCREFFRNLNGGAACSTATEG